MNARGRVTILIVAILLSSIVMTQTGTAGAPAPSYPHDFPDPAAVQVGNTFYAYSTNVFPFGNAVNVPVLQSTDMANWSVVADALPNLGSWATEGFTWAPHVAKVGNAWVLYYTAQDTSSGRQCIGRATSGSPTGPFTDSFGAPLMCPLDRAGAIDPTSFVATGGQRYLLFKSEDDVLGGSAVIWSAPLSPDGTALTGAATPLLGADAGWEDNTIEGPALIQSGNTFFLFYGGNHFGGAAYGIGYATCTSVTGPCTKRSTSQPWMSTARTGIQGPGGPAILLSGSQPFLFFHGWIHAVGYPDGERAMYVQPLDLSSGTPWVPALPPIYNRFLRDSNTSGVATTRVTFGEPGDVQLTCDVTGTAVDTPVIFRRGRWFLRDSNTSGIADHNFGFGDPGDFPVCGDWNNDGVDTPGVVRRGVWYLRNTNTGGFADRTVGFGDPSDRPIVGRWTNAGTSIGVHRGGQFLLSTNLGAPYADLVVRYGDLGDVPVIGDWNGDGIDTPGVVRSGRWFLRDSNTNGNADVVFSYGDAGDTPIAGDWNGNGNDNPGIVR